MRLVVPCLLAAFAARASAAPLFVEHTEYLGTQPCGPSDTGCYTNYLQMADLDGDGTLDLVFPNANGYFTKANPAEPLVYLHGDGGFAFSDASATLGGGFTGWLRQVAIGDVDGDGSLDLFAPSAWQDADALFVNDGNGNFTDEAAARLGGSHSHAGATRFADVDGDGDLDLFVANWGAAPQSDPWSLDLWLNDGTGHFTKADAQLPTGTFFQSGTPVDVDVADVDGDFDLDLLIDRHDQDLELLLNDGAGHFTDAGAQAVPGGLHYNPVFCDVDGDGDLDLFVDNAPANGANESLFLNDGAGHFAASAGLSAVGDGGSDDNGVACLDVDGDGDLDAAIASLSGNERILINDGSGSFTLSPDGFPAVSDSTLWFDFGDLNGDGRLDAVTGQGESGASWLNRLYVGSNGMAVDTRAPVFRKVQTFAAPGDGAAVTFRFAVVDSATSDTGPRLTDAHVAWTVGGGATQTAPATFAGGDLFQAKIPGEPKGSSVSWQVCATDRAGNQACSPSKSYTVTGTVTPPGNGGGKGCGCDLDGGASPLAGALLGLAALLANRRRGR